MRDKLKEYIQQHRDRLDSLHPPDGLWDMLNVKIDHDMNIKGGKGFTGWKIATVISVPVVTTMVFLGAAALREEPSYIADTTEKTLMIEPVASFMEELSIDTLAEVMPVAREVRQVEPIIQAPEKVDPEPTAERQPAAETVVVSTELATAPIYTIPKPVSHPQPATPKLAPAPPQPCCGILGRAINSKNQVLINVDTLFKGVNRLEIDGMFTDINIKQQSADHVRVNGKIDIQVKGLHGDISNNYNLNFFKEDSTLRVQFGCAKVTVMIGSMSIDAKLDFNIPASVRTVVVECSSGDATVGPFTGDKLTLSTVSGDIDTKDISAETELQSSSGDQVLSGGKGNVTSKSVSGNQQYLNVEGNLSAKSTSGNIRIEKLKGNAEVKSVSGDLPLKDIKGEVETASSSGDITLSYVTGPISVKTVSGHIICQEIKGKIIAKSSSGDVTVSSVQGDFSAATVSGTIEGKGVRAENYLEYSSTSGDIEISLLNDMKELKFELESLSGDLKISKQGDSVSGDRKLNHGTGPIKIKGNTVSGHQRYE